MLRTISSKTAFEENIEHSKSHHIEGGYPENLVQRNSLRRDLKIEGRSSNQNLFNKQEYPAFCDAIPPSSIKLKTDTHEKTGI